MSASPKGAKHLSPAQALLCLALTFSGLSASGQLLLNEGETYTYEFSTLPLLPGEPSNEPWGMVSVSWGSSQFSDTLRLDMFEGSTSEAPLYSVTAEGNFSEPAQIFYPFAWRDLQGAFRVTMIKGSGTFHSVDLRAWVGTDTYGTTFVPVPEPSSLSLLGLAAALGLTSRIILRRKRR